MNSKELTAIGHFNNGANCAQSILLTFAPELGYTPEQCLRMTSGMGGGIGHTQSVCGAVNAGALIISMRFGNENIKDVDRKQLATQKVEEYIKECLKSLGTIECKTILGIDLKDPVQVNKARNAGLFDMVCNNAIRVVCGLLENERFRNSG